MEEDTSNNYQPRERQCGNVTIRPFLMILFWLCWVFIAAPGLSLVAASGGCSLVAVHSLLTAVVSLVVE